MIHWGMGEYIWDHGKERINERSTMPRVEIHGALILSHIVILSQIEYVWDVFSWSVKAHWMR